MNIQTVAENLRATIAGKEKDSGRGFDSRQVHHKEV